MSRRQEPAMQHNAPAPTPRPTSPSVAAPAATPDDRQTFRPLTAERARRLREEDTLWTRWRRRLGL